MGIAFIGQEIPIKHLIGRFTETGSGETNPTVFPNLFRIILDIFFQFDNGFFRRLSGFESFDDILVITGGFDGPGQINLFSFPEDTGLKFIFRTGSGVVQGKRDGPDKGFG
jgi:hypothetical protein